MLTCFHVVLTPETPPCAVPFLTLDDPPRHAPAILLYTPALFSFQPGNHAIRSCIPQHSALPISVTPCLWNHCGASFPLALHFPSARSSSYKSKEGSLHSKMSKIFSKTLAVTRSRSKTNDLLGRDKYTYYRRCMTHVRRCRMTEAHSTY